MPQLPVGTNANVFRGIRKGVLMIALDVSFFLGIPGVNLRG